jgi:hypothetical protein
MQSALSFFGKIAISGLLFYGSIKVVDLRGVLGRFGQLRSVWLLPAVSIIFVQILLQSLRWQLLLKACGTPLPLGQLFRFSMIGLFFNQTLPSSVGGDTMRIWLTKRRTGWRSATYSVLLDRAFGMVALAGLVAACLPRTLELVTDPVGRSTLVLIGLGTLVGWSLFLALSWHRIRGLLTRHTVMRRLAELASLATTVTRRPSLSISVFGLSLLIQSLTALMAWCLGRAIGTDFPLLSAIFLIPPVMLLTVMPVTVGGWGLREGMMVVAFTYAGLQQSDGFVVSLLFGLTFLLIGGIGGFVWLLPKEDQGNEDPMQSSIVSSR